MKRLVGRRLLRTRSRPRTRKRSHLTEPCRCEIQAYTVYIDFLVVKSYRFLVHVNVNRFAVNVYVQGQLVLCI